MKFKVRGIRLDTGIPASGTVEAFDEAEARAKAERRLQIISLVLIDTPDGIPVARVSAFPSMQPAIPEPAAALPARAYATPVSDPPVPYADPEEPEPVPAEYATPDDEEAESYAVPVESAVEESPLAEMHDGEASDHAPDDVPAADNAYAHFAYAETMSTAVEEAAPDDAPTEPANEEETEAAYAAAYVAAVEPVIDSTPVVPVARSQLRQAPPRTTQNRVAVAADVTAEIPYANGSSLTPDYKDILVGNKWLKLYATIVTILAWLCVVVGAILFTLGVIASASRGQGIAVSFSVILPGLAVVMNGVVLFVIAGAIRLLCGVGMAVRDMARHTLSR